MADIDDTAPAPLALDQWPPPSWYGADGQFALPQPQQVAVAIPNLNSTGPGQPLPPPPPPSLDPTGGGSVGVPTPPQQVIQTPTLQQEVALPALSDGPTTSAAPQDPYAPQPQDPYAPSQQSQQSPLAQQDQQSQSPLAQQKAEQATTDADQARYEGWYKAQSPQQQLRALSPQEYKTNRADAVREATRTSIQQAADLRSSTEDLEQANRDNMAYKTAAADSARRRGEIEQQLATLGKQHISEKLPADREVAGIIASAIGGFQSQWTGGRNLGLESYEKSLDRHISTQQSDLANQRQVLASRGQLVSEADEANQRDWSNANLMRARAYDGAIRQHQLEAQNYDPQGTTAQRINANMGELQTRRQQAIDAWQQQDLKARVDAYKTQWDAVAKRAAVQKDLAGPKGTPAPISGAIENPYTHAMENYGGGAPATTGTGGGSAAGAPTGFPFKLETVDPFSQGDMYSKRKLSAAQEGEVNKAGQHYSKAQDAAAAFAGEVRRGGAESSYLEKLVGKTPERQQFEAKRAALIQALAEGSPLRGSVGGDEEKGMAVALADWESQVPEAESWIKSLSGGGGAEALLGDLQERLDGQYRRTVSGLGVYVPGVVKNASTVRAPAPAPALENQRDASQRVLETAPAGSDEAKSAKAENEEANKRDVERMEREDETKMAVAQQVPLAVAARNVGEPPTLDGEGYPPAVRAAINSHNQALKRLTDAHAKLLKLAPSSPELGDRALAARDAQVGASQTLHAVGEAIRDHFDEIPLEKQEELQHLAAAGVIPARLQKDKNAIDPAYLPHRPETPHAKPPAPSASKVPAWATPALMESDPNAGR